MQAIILATDEAPPGRDGPKLHPLTERVPAPLLPVLNRPLMAYPLELLVRAGLRDIGVAVYNKAGSIEARFGAGTGAGARLTYLLQREPLGTAGSLRWAASGLKETFVVLPGDAIVDVDIGDALEFHRSHGDVATVVVHALRGSGGPESDYPLRPVALGPKGRVTGFSADEQVPASQDYADTGVYIFEPRILDCIATLQRQLQRQALDCHADLLPQMLAAEAAHAYVAEGYWNPIHNVAAYHRAQLDALASAVAAPASALQSSTANGVSQTGGTPGVRYVSTQDKGLAPGILAGRHARVHPAARLVAPVYIGAGSQIEGQVELGPNVVIGPNTIVDEGATIRNSSILEGTYVGRLLKVEGRVVRGSLVIDTGSGEGLRVEDPFLLAESSPRLIVSVLSRVADSVGALLLLLLSLPALALVTLALLLTSLFADSPGRVFELRSRVRWRRASEVDAPERQTYGVPYFRTRRSGGRLLPLGAFLERTQLGRLPALVGVLKGDLRLVGVKPLHPAEADRLVEEWQRLPYEGPAGFTGLWYVQATGADLDEVVATDAYYTATRSFGEDVRLLLLTPIAWASRFAPNRADSRKRQWKRRRSQAPRQILAGSLAPASKDVKD
jgi:NDP-sugar pyrophosphorylase family protein